MLNILFLLNYYSYLLLSTLHNRITPTLLLFIASSKCSLDNTCSSFKETFICVNHQLLPNFLIHTRVLGVQLVMLEF